jgi:hypoxanthine-DNA glycosylase
VIRHRSFAPVIDANIRLLILGSLPGAASLAAARYYAHSRNQFWALIGGILEVDFVGIPYEDRLATLLAHGVGLWDVIAEAAREGSLDAAISDPFANDLAVLVSTLPKLDTVAFNGGKAAALGAPLLAPFADRLALVRLPSSSPANARLPVAAKLAEWRRLLCSFSVPC